MGIIIVFNEWFFFKRIFGLSKVIYVYSLFSYFFIMRIFVSLIEKVKNKLLFYMKNIFC